MNEHHEDLVSIITPNYNGAEFLPETIQSVLDQTYSNWEMLISDDGSNDNSIEVIEGIEDPRVKLVERPRKNEGVGASRNYAIKQAQGNFIAFLDGDDLWTPEKLTKQIQFMKDNDLDFSFSHFDVIDEEGRTIGEVCRGREKASYKTFLKHLNKIGCLTAIYKTDNIGKVYSPLIKKRQDYALWLEVFKKTDKALRINEILASYRVRAGSVSRNKFSAAYYVWKVYREVEGFGLLKSSYYFIHYALYHLGIIAR